MRKGTVVLVPFPFTDLSGNKVRPCLVLYEQKNGEDCIISFISSVKPGKGSHDINLPATTKNGLKVDSWIKIEKIATLQKKIFLGELGTVDQETLKKVSERLKKIFQLT